MQSNTYTVRCSVWPSFRPLIARIAKAAAKLGTHFEIAVSAPRVAEHCGDPVHVVDVTVSAEVPRINGWAFAAAVDHLEGGNILRVSPAFKSALPESFRHDAATCDHCRTIRARSTTYGLVATDGSGRFVRVGSSCLRDFTGHGDAVALVEWASLLATLGAGLSTDPDADSEGGARREALYWVRETVVDVLRAIRENRGAYVSVRRASDTGEESTAARVLRHYHSKRDADKLADEATDADRATADAAIAWAAGLTDDSDFAHNMRTVAKLEAVGPRHFGLACYVAEGYRRHLGEVAARATTTPSKALGAAKDKVVFDFVLTGVNSSESAYGTTYWFRGMAGTDKVTIKSSTGSMGGIDDPQPGERFHVKATVKAVDEFRGVTGTTVIRAKAVRLV